jgi:hypothetical protein
MKILFSVANFEVGIRVVKYYYTFHIIIKESENVLNSECFC